jgi:hypothetical protein
VLIGAATKFTISASTTTPAVNGSVNLTITAKDSANNTVTTYTGSKSLTFSGALASPSGTKPTAANSSGTATSFGRAASASVSAADGTLTTAPLAFTVSPGTAARVAFDGVTASAGSVSSVCRLTCTVSSLGNSGTITGGLAITDSLGNAVSAIGSSKAIIVTVTCGGTITGSPLTIPAAGEAATATDFSSAAVTK